MKKALPLFLALLCSGWVSAAFGDDLADEADQLFRRGRELHAKKDFQNALLDFLASNRLVPNPNVLFNVAATYERLGDYPSAYRYYAQALALAKDPESIERFKGVLARIEPHVAIVDVATDPPGATVYVGRKNLGPHGSTPLRLAFDTSVDRVFVELDGYESLDFGVPQVTIGSPVTLRAPLKLIVGQLELGGTEGMTVRVDSPESAPLPEGQSRLDLRPGRHRLYLSKPGHRSIERDVDVSPNLTLRLRVELEAIAGTLLVTADEPDALVEVDGRPFGYAPGAFSLPEGPHRLRVSKAGFRPVESDIRVDHTKPTRLDASFQQIQEVEAASRETQATEDAPSSVTIIRSEELRAMGYPTVAEALRGVRGIYLSDDTAYTTVGVRGFGRLGDYGNRILTLLNGVPLNDDWAGTSFIGYDALVDLHDVERIEVVRGAGSLLYGTGAFAGVVNIVTRKAPQKLGTRASLGASGDSTLHGRLALDVPFRHETGMWLAGGGAWSDGRDFFFPELSPSSAEFPTGGESRGADGFVAGNLMGGLWLGWLRVGLHANVRTKTLPAGVFGTKVGDDRTRFTDRRAFVELDFQPPIDSDFSLRTRLVGNYYGFGGAFESRTPSLGFPDKREQEDFQGLWGTLEQRASWAPTSTFKLTLGGELQAHATQQRGIDADCVEGGECIAYNYLPPTDTFDPSATDRHSFLLGAGYAILDVEPIPVLSISAGARLDQYSTFGSSGPSPRVAFIFRPVDSTVVKLMGGRAFRAPSIYEQFYQIAGSQIASPGLVPETVWSGELELQRRFSTTITATVAGFSNYMDNLIVEETTGPPESQVIFFDNGGAPVLTVGGEAELRRDWRGGAMFVLSYSVQRTRYQGDTTSRNVPNSPTHIASARGALPLHGASAVLGARLTAESGRYDTHDAVDDPVAQGKVAGAAILDLVLSGDVVARSLHYNFGFYNLADARQEHPVSSTYPMRAIPQRGRTLLVGLEWIP